MGSADASSHLSTITTIFVPRSHLNKYNNKIHITAIVSAPPTNNNNANLRQLPCKQSQTISGVMHATRSIDRAMKLIINAQSFVL